MLFPGESVQRFDRDVEACEHPRDVNGILPFRSALEAEHGGSLLNFFGACIVSIGMLERWASLQRAFIVSIRMLGRLNAL